MASVFEEILISDVRQPNGMSGKRSMIWKRPMMMRIEGDETQRVSKLSIDQVK
jgi:hypothetical protein